MILSNNRPILLLFSVSCYAILELRNINGGIVLDNKQLKFRNLGVMVDCSRNAVMSVEQLKTFITVTAKMGYNQVHLYMEDTYEIDDEPFFGYLRGRYSKAELKELGDFAYGLGVELVPNIQTLAHMDAFVGWRPDIRDINNILLVGEEKTYDLIERMFRSLRECFRTNKLHIGMDEAFMLGRGQYYDKHGPVDRFDILLSHLNRVCDIADRYGFEPMMWSDMFFRIANGGEYRTDNLTFDESIKEKIPEKLTLVYWDYFSRDKKKYDMMIKNHFRLTDRVSYAGACWKWQGFVPDNRYTNRVLKAALETCINDGIQDVLITMWGDDGCECSNLSLLPSLCYAACLAQGITRMADVRAKFFECVGVRYDDYILLDLPDYPDTYEAEVVANPTKYFLYADCFMSKFANIEKAEYTEFYTATARRLRYAAKRAGEFAYLFDTLAKLCSALCLKQNICSRTREAYNSGDKAQLDKIIVDYRTMIKRTREFYYAYRKQWYMENKPHGFDVQDLRLGGLIGRMTSCMERLIAYRNGEIASIPELEEEIVPIINGINRFNIWAQTVSNNIVGRQFI